MKDGFVKVAAASPEIKTAGCDFNAEQIKNYILKLDERGVKIVVFPELCITGYTCGDLFLQRTLTDGAESAMQRLISQTAQCDILCAVGAPVRFNDKLYNCAVVFCRGQILGIVPKSFMPNYSEFYELRHFSPASDSVCSITFAGQTAPFGTDIIFSCSTLPSLSIAVEICEDLWAANSPSLRHCAAGATVILNLSASDETIGKAEYRRNLVCMQSAKLICGYIYSDASYGESTTDLIFAGHKLICENGTMLAQSKLFDCNEIISELDVERLQSERCRMNTYPSGEKHEAVPFALNRTNTKLTRYIDPSPFVPVSDTDRNVRCDIILSLQAAGLAKRIEHTGAHHVVIGVSGGLDSTLALLVAVKALDMLNRDHGDIIAVTMPCFGTTKRTRSNAERLCGQLKIQLRCINITDAVLQHFRDIEHNPDTADVVYENSQARERTQVLMDIANAEGGFVVGTGDLSELALGWATYNGDHMSGYGVNASVPKTLVRHIVRYYADTCGSERLSETLLDILNTPVSPELLPPTDGKISQQTEDIVGPYELHDFYLYYFVRLGFKPRKILRLALIAWGGTYDEPTIRKWLTVFLKRFFAQQFKRSCLPDGPKVGSVTLSPRGDWRMPSDACAALWLSELENN